MPDLTLKQIAERLGASVPTVKRWRQQGHFPNARLEQTPIGPVWLVPLADVKAFKRPVMGRPGPEKPKPAKKPKTKPRPVPKGKK
jgi:excisionase family DNA binding protein